MKRLKLIVNNKLATIALSLIFVIMLSVNITMAYYRDSVTENNGNFIVGSVDISAGVNAGQSFNLTPAELLPGETTLRSITITNNGLDDTYIRIRPVITLDSAATTLITMDVDNGGTAWVTNADTWYYYNTPLLFGTGVAVDTDIIVSNLMESDSSNLAVDIKIEIQATQVANNTADPTTANWTT